MPEIACLGILVADLLGRPIDALPQKGRLGLVDQMTLHIGGCAANTGIGLARLGVQTAVLGKVGVDGLGDFVVRTLERENVDTRGVIRDSEIGTSATMVLVSSDGERTFLHHLGGNARFHESDVNWEAVNGARILHVAGALVMPGLDGEPMARALRRAQESGIITTLDVVWDATGKWMQTLQQCLPYIDYFLPSLAEAEQITGRTGERDSAKALRDEGVGTVGIKLGGEGCFVQTAGTEMYVSGFPVNPVDGTGGGDAWDAGFLVGLLRGWDLQRTARFANAVGAMCVTQIGATAGIRSLDETEAFIASHQI